jgi:predicted AAA+ superfamily ATPase
MPEAVNEYYRSNSIIEAHKVHTNLFQSYLDDMGKYSRKIDISDLDLVFASIARNVGKQIKYSTIAPDWRAEKTKTVLNLLEKMLFIHKITSTSANGLPLNVSAKEKVFKLLFLDIGLMHTICGVSPEETLCGNLVDIFKGALTEQFAGQQILTDGGCENRKMFYWSRQEKSSIAEVDYIIVRNGQIIPVEIKSGTSGRLKSLNLFLLEHPNCPKGLVLSSANISKDSNLPVYHYPLYSKFEQV